MGGKRHLGQAVVCAEPGGRHGIRHDRQYRRSRSSAQCRGDWPRSEPTGHRPVTGWIIDQDPRCDRRPGQSDPVFADPRPSARSGRIRCSVDRSERRRGDRRQDADDRVVQPLKQAGIEAVIPPRSKRRTARNYDRELYKVRHLIENFFCKLKLFAALPCGSAPSRHATISWHGTSRRLFSSPPP